MAVILMEGFILAEKIENEIINDSNEETTHSTESEAPDNIEEFSNGNDIPKSSGDFVKAKQKFNDYIKEIKDNQVVNLMILNDSNINGGVSFGDYKFREIEVNADKIDKEYDLSIAEEFAEFGEKVKGGEYFSVAIILCVFEYVELDDLQDLKDKLLKELPPTIDNEGNEVAVYQNPFLPISSILKTIKGKMFISNSGENCIGLGNIRKDALKNLWFQFPAIRKSIARWMINVSDSFKYRTNFNLTQIVTAFVNIFKLDFNAGVTHFFKRFFSYPDKYLFLGLIAVELYHDPSYRDKILPYINQWAESSGSWKWKSAIYVYSNIEKGEENLEFEQKVKKSLLCRCEMLEYDDLRKENLPYISTLLIGSKQFRSLVASILNELICNTINYQKKQLICLWYLEFLRYGYYLVSEDLIALPLVACDSKKQLEYLLPIINICLSSYDLRKFLFLILESYMKEISKYNVPMKIINSLKAFFMIIMETNNHFSEDVLLFLKKCNCSITKKLVQHMLTYSNQLQIKNNKPMISENNNNKKE